MIIQEELTALSWLHGKLKLNVDDVNLYYLVGNLRQGKYKQYYDHWLEEGRPIWKPKEELATVQKAIARILLPEFPRHPVCFGFSGGNCRQAAEKHLGYKSVLTFDLRHAFSQITHFRVFNALYNGCYEPPRLSFYSARFVADLCTVGDVDWMDHPFKSFGGYLPQGAPTSPRLFDLCTTPLDDSLSEWAKRFNLGYTRYADNLFFSSAQEEFPSRLRSALLSEAGKHFRVHKVRQVRHSEICRMLGLNLRTDSVSNTREFKRSFRGGLHHLEYVLKNGLDHTQAWQVVSGFAGFAIPVTLPKPLWDKFLQLKQQIHSRIWGW